ncbi:MAG: YfaZ family outer membrane protein [Burkholderiales bacterium]
MHLRSIVFVLLALASRFVSAGSVDVNLSNETIEAKLYVNATTADWVFGILHNRDQEDWAASAGLLSAGESAFAGSRIEGGLGGKIYGVSASNSDVLALALGFQARWFPGNGPFALTAYAFYAPRVVTLADGTQFFDMGLRAEFEVMKNSYVYIGYRQMRTELDNNIKVDLDKGGFAGIQIKF